MVAENVETEFLNIFVYSRKIDQVVQRVNTVHRNRIFH